MDVVKNITANELTGAGTTPKKFKAVVSAFKTGPDKDAAKAELERVFKRIRMQRRRKSTAKLPKGKKPKGPTVHVLFLDINGVWHESLATQDTKRAEIRYVDLQTLYPAVAATTVSTAAANMNGLPHADAKAILHKIKKRSRGVPVKGLKRLADKIPELDRNGLPVVYVDSRGASYVSVPADARQNFPQPGNLRPGLATNTYTTVTRPGGTSLMVNTGLLPEQVKLMNEQRRLRKKYGYRENEAV